MPSFLSKVFGRKKDDSSGHGPEGSLLEGKFEAVSPTISPTAEKFLAGANANGNGSAKEKEKEKERGKEKGKDKEIGFLSLKTKSTTQETPVKKPEYRLTLNLPGPKNDANARAIRAVFEADPAELLLSDVVIGQRRLNPLETLVLVRGCSQAIMARGLETLGIMHPHWYSASPEVQRRLLSLFIQSLAPNSPITTLSPSLASPAATFESEINHSHSPHDVAAVLRWGFRHLKLDSGSFGNDSEWYKRFFEAEKSAQYPPKAFSEKLAPLVPPTHLELLSATLDLFSSLAAHSEANSISGSKLSKLLGLWLLATERVQSGDDWFSFYSRWDRTGRMMEHLFLSHIRNEVADHRMPKRLTELVQHYPYTKHSQSSSESDLLPRPRFSTRRYDALFVHVDTEESFPGAKPNKDLRQLIVDALKAELAVNSSDYVELWNKVRQLASEDVDSSVSPLAKYPGLSRIFSDETIRLLSLLPSDDATTEKPTFNLHIPPTAENRPTRRRSMSLGDKGTADAAVSKASPRREVAVTDGTLDASISTGALGIDWTQFSTSGFLENIPSGSQLAATLMDKDIEVTVPRTHKKTRSGSTNRPRKSTDVLPPITIPTFESKPASTEEPIKPSSTSKTTQVSIVQLDEAFIDFWSDALLDPISSDWPRFIIGRFKTSVPGLELDGGKKLEWLVVEQAHVKPKPPVVTPLSATTETSPTNGTVESRSARPTSPKPSFRSDVSEVLSSTKKRFSFLGSVSRSSSSRGVGVEKDTKTKKVRKGGVSPKVGVGEMGEILKEEEGEEDVGKRRLSVGGGSTVQKQSVEVPRTVKEEKEEKEEKEKDVGEGEGVSVAGIAAVATGVVVAGAAVVVAEAASKVDTPAPAPALETKDAQSPTTVASEPIASTTAPPAPEPEAVSEPLAVPEVATLAASELPAVEVPAETSPAAEGVSPEEPVSVVESALPVSEEPAAPEVLEAAPNVPEEELTPAPASEVVPVVEEEVVVEEPTAVPAPAPDAVVEAAPVLTEELAEPEVEEEPVSAPVAADTTPALVETAVAEEIAQENVAVEEPAPATVESVPVADVDEVPQPAEEPAPAPAPTEAEPVEELADVEEPVAVESEVAEPEIVEEQEESTPEVEEPAEAPVVESESEAVQEAISVEEPAVVEEDVEAEVPAPVEPAPIEEAVEEPAAPEPASEPVVEPVEAKEVVAEVAEEEEEPVAEVTELAEPPVEEIVEEPAVTEPAPEPVEEPVAEPSEEKEVIAEVAEEESVAEVTEPAEPVAAAPTEEAPVEEAVEEPVATLESEPVAEPAEPLTPETVESAVAVPDVVPPTEEIVEEPSVTEPVAEPTELVVDDAPDTLAVDASVEEPIEEAAPEPEPATEPTEAVTVPEPLEDAPVIINETAFVPESAIPQVAEEATFIEITEPAQESVSNSAPEVSDVPEVPPPSDVPESAPEDEFEVEIAADTKASATPTFAEETLVAEPIAEDANVSEPVTMLPDVHVEPLREPSPGPQEDAVVSQAPVPVVDAEIPPPSANGIHSEVVESFEEKEVEHSDTPEVQVAVESELPPAPENVVLSGETPGPQVALSTSEPVAASLASSPEEPVAEVEPLTPPGLGDDVVEQKEVVDPADVAQTDEVSEATAVPADVAQPEDTEVVHEKEPEYPVESANNKAESDDASTPVANESSNGHAQDTEATEATEAEESETLPAASEAS